MFVTPKWFRLRVLAITGLAALAAIPVLAVKPGHSGAPESTASARYGKLPLSFEANQGQFAGNIQFVSRGKGYSLSLTNRAAVLALTKDANSPALPGGALSRRAAGPKGSGASAPATTTDAIEMQLAGANPALHAEGDSQLPGFANYFLGNDPAKWRTNVPTYAKVRYRHVYDGVDLVYYGNQSQLEYDFIVAPGADPRPIRLQFEGARKLALNATGDLEVFGQNGQIAFHKPVVYQEMHGLRQPVAGRFTLLGDNTVSFRVGRYDHAQPLVIDPVLSYSTYLGGTNGGDFGDYGSAVAVDSIGSAYITGHASSTNFPVTKGAFQLVNNEGQYGANAFVTKLNSSGTALVYSTYLGGSSDDDNAYGLGIAVDSAGNAYVAGYTNQNDFPVTKGAFQTVSGGGPNAFITKLNSTGTGLIYSTYLGGDAAETSGDYANAIALDSSGNAYLTGSAGSSNFPVTKGAFQTVNNNPGLGNAFVAKVNAAGSALVYATYLGGSRVGNTGDYGGGIAVDKSGDAYVAGGTYATNFPTTFGSYQTVNLGQRNAFVSKLNAAGSALVYSTYLGGNFADSAAAIAVDSSGDAYVTGQAGSSDFPVTTGAFQIKAGWTTLGGSNAFVTKFNPAGTALLYSTYLGGNGEGGYANAITLDPLGDAYLTGRTDSTNFPLTSGAFQTTNDAYGGSAFVTKIDPTGSALLYSTYLSGSGLQGVGGDTGEGIAIDPATGDAFVTGQTYSANFPVTAGAYQTTNRGNAAESSNAFVSRLNIGGETTTAITANANPAQQGSTVVLTAKVAANYGAVTPTGTVAFVIDGVAEATVSLNSAGQAAYSTATLGLGKHTVVATYSGSTAYLTSQVVDYETIAIATPILSPASGTYAAAQSVTITDATPGVTLYYTSSLKGTVPSASSTKYTGAIPVSSAGNTVIEAIAVLSGYPNSGVAIATYTIEPGTPTPTITPTGGTSLTEAQLVSIANSTKSPTATIYYTTNGTTPTSASNKYTAPFLVAANETVSAIAVATGDSPSTVAAAKFTFVDAPTLLAGPATAITTSSATLNAYTSTQGIAATCYFQYGASATALSSATTKTALNSLPTVLVSGPLTGLKTKTVYYYQFVITTAAGSVLGPVLSFTTN